MTVRSRSAGRSFPWAASRRSSSPPTGPGITTIILPRENEKDLDDLPERSGPSSSATSSTTSTKWSGWRSKPRPSPPRPRPPRPRPGRRPPRASRTDPPGGSRTRSRPVRHTPHLFQALMTRKESPVSRTPKTARPVAVNSPLGRTVRLSSAHSAGERPRGLPLPSVVVLGRSNVGKSSLLNAVLATKVARVSQTPGRTQALHWYRVDDRLPRHRLPRLRVREDEPGLARAVRREDRDLLTGERRPDRALLLVDGRLEPQDSDRSMGLFLEPPGSRRSWRRRSGTP